MSPTVALHHWLLNQACISNASTCDSVRTTQVYSCSKTSWVAILTWQSKPDSHSILVCKNSLTTLCNKGGKSCDKGVKNPHCLLYEKTWPQEEFKSVHGHFMYTVQYHKSQICNNGLYNLYTIWHPLCPLTTQGSIRSGLTIWVNGKVCLLCTLSYLGSTLLERHFSLKIYHSSQYQHCTKHFNENDMNKALYIVGAIVVDFKVQTSQPLLRLFINCDPNDINNTVSITILTNR